MSHTQYAVSETYEDMKGLILDTVRRFCEPRDLPMHEILSDANVLFMEAYLSYDYDYGTSFSTWLRNIIWNRLLSQGREEVRKAKVRRFDRGFDVLWLQDKSNTPWLYELTRDLSRDAVMVVMLAVECPEEIQWILRERARIHRRKYDKLNIEPRTLRSVIKEHLREDLGWDEERINRIFEEIRKAI